MLPIFYNCKFIIWVKYENRFVQSYVINVELDIY